MNIEEIYQQHIKSLPRAEQLKLLAKVAAELSQDNSDETKEHSIMELHGLGAEIWQGVDTQDYVNELRNANSNICVLLNKNV